MRFAFLIPAITALGIAGCQVPPPMATAPVSTATPVASGASEAAAGAVMETNEQTNIADTTTDPDVTTAGKDDAPSTAQETAAESVTPDNGAEEAIPETKTDEQATELPATEIAGAPVDAAVDTSVDAPEIAPEDAAPDVAQDTEQGTEQNGPEAEIADAAPPATTELALATPPPPPPPPPELAPQALIGLDSEGLKLRLGDADFKRREGQVETWQYRFPICVVDYFLYPDAASPAVRNWAWRSPVIGGTLDIVACRRALARRERAG